MLLAEKLLSANERLAEVLAGEADDGPAAGPREGEAGEQAEREAAAGRKLAARVGELEKEVRASVSAKARPPSHPHGGRDLPRPVP